MKKILLIGLLLLGSGISAQVINFPDANFKNKLLSANVAYNLNYEIANIDTNGDGEIEQSEAMQVSILSVTNANISTLDGIEYFQNLERLYCQNNQITSFSYTLPMLNAMWANYNSISTLDLSDSPLLDYLEIHTNQLTSLENLPVSIGTIQCSHNLLPSLNLSLQTSLKRLFCSNNQITSLVCNSGVEYFDVSDNPLPLFNPAQYPSLISLMCNNIGSENLNLMGCATLKRLACSGNPFTILNTIDLVNLNSFQLENSQLTELDLSHSPLQQNIIIEDNELLQSINLHNGSSVSEAWINIYNNPVLEFMCIDEGEEEELTAYFEQQNTTPPFMSADCSFAPGNEYNIIKGVVKYDFDNNGCSVSDNAAGYLKVKINDGTNEKIRYTNAEGEYRIKVSTGDFDVSVEVDSGLFNVAPISASINFTALNGTEQTFDFCLAGNDIYPDAEIVLIPDTPASPGFDATYKVILTNRGNQVLSGVVTFNFDDTLTDFVVASPLQTSVAPGIVLWDYHELLPFEIRSFYVSLNVNAPTETPAVNIGDVLASSVSVTSVEGDDNLDNNHFEFDHVVVGSFDPNNIICLQGDVEDPAAIGDYLHYVINFENIGDEAASFVVVMQEIDETMYDMDSFELISTSHNVDATLTGNVVEFRFNDINLGADQMGDIVYKIKSLQTLEEGDHVMNKANIVFDYNIPIPTNEAKTTFETLMGNGEFTMDNSVKVYPNPANGLVKIDAGTEIKTIYLYDIHGRQLQANYGGQVNVFFDVSGRASGIYFVKIVTEKGIKVEKLIRE